MSDAALYDFETALEDAFAESMQDAGLTVCTPRTFMQFRQSRPRVDIMFQAGAAKKGFHIIDGVKRNATWNGQLHCVVVTDGDGSGSADHRSYRAKVRRVIADLLNTINSLEGDVKKYLACHVVQDITEAGTSTSYEAAQGVEESVILANVDFGIDRAAWAELST